LTLIDIQDYSEIKLNGVENLDNNGIFKHFEEIEGKVENLIEVCRSLDSTNAELRNKIEGLEQKLQSKEKEGKRFEEQKVEVRSKIDTLLSKLNSFSQS
jgi:chromosome segregation ATPase